MSGYLKISSLTTQLGDAERRFQLVVENLRIDGGQAVALTGPSGSGKTLLLELLGLLRKPDAGAGYLLNVGPDQLDLAAPWFARSAQAQLSSLRGSVFGFVPQSGGLMPFLSVADNIALPQRLTGRGDADWVTALAERLRIAEVLPLKPAALSIGQRQRVAIARALSHRPAFVIADEPTAALDPETSDSVLELLLELAQDQGAGVLLSSHDHDRIAQFGLGRLALRTERTDDHTVTSRLEVAA